MGANNSKSNKSKRSLRSNDSNSQLYQTTSDESLTNTGNLFSKSLFLKKKTHNRASSLILEQQKSRSNSTLASGATDYDTYNMLDHDDTVINAAAMRVNQRYEQEKVAMLQEHSSCTPCIISQHPDFSSRKDLCDDATSSIYTSSTTITSSSSPPPPPDSTSVASASSTHKRKSSQYSDWLRSGGTSTMRKKVTSQEVMLNLFIQPNSEVDRRKEKDRQQRLVSLTSHAFHTHASPCGHQLKHTYLALFTKTNLARHIPCRPKESLSYCQLVLWHWTMGYGDGRLVSWRQSDWRRLQGGYTVQFAAWHSQLGV